MNESRWGRQPRRLVRGQSVSLLLKSEDVHRAKDTMRSLEAANETGTAAFTVAHVTTVGLSLYFLSGQASFLRKSGFALHAISSPDPESAAFHDREGVPLSPIPMTRRISPLLDLRALWRVWRILRRIRPDIVHAHTPKGGLLGMIAAWLAGTPVRVLNPEALA